MSETWRVDNNGTGETVSIYQGEHIIADVYDDSDAFGIVRDHDAARRLEAAEARERVLRDAIEDAIQDIRYGALALTVEHLRAALAAAPAAEQEPREGGAC